ncbi:hypothetical protein GLOTRDRAFT_14745, partial [Gloeophyllum trabeum ATCC 11539]
LQGFKSRSSQYTILPTPLPDDAPRSPINDFYFTDSPTQDSLAVMDACLKIGALPRAQKIFHLLREQRRGDPVLEPRLFNAFLNAYVNMATTNAEERDKWLGDAIQLFSDMQEGKDRVRSTAGSYA